MDVRGAKIVGLGSYVPERILTNFDLEKMVDTTDEWIVSHTGMKERHLAADDQATSDLAYEAAVAALRDADLDPNDLDLIIVATVTPDMPFPSTASLVQGRLAANKAGAFDLMIGCTGFVYALAVATSMVQSGAINHALVIAAETLSRLVDWATARRACCSATAPGQWSLARLSRVKAFKLSSCAPTEPTGSTCACRPEAVAPR